MGACDDLHEITLSTETQFGGSDRATWFKRLSIRKVPVLISTVTLTILTKVFRGCPLFLLSFFWIVPQIRSLPLPFMYFLPY
jgi:hypothetical protein